MSETLEALSAIVLRLERMIAEHIDRSQHDLDRIEARTNEKFGWQDKQLLTAMNSADKATLKAEAADDKRFAGVNELRGALDDATAKFMKALQDAQEKFVTKTELSPIITSVSDRIIRLERSDAERMGIAAHVAALDERLTRLDRADAERTGSMDRGRDAKQTNMWVIATVVSTFLAMVSMGIAVAAMFATKR